MKAIERLKQYIDFKGLNNSLFEKEIGMSNGYIGTQLKRKADLGEGVIIKILDNCLDIDLEWLITGKGNMIKGDQSKNENKVRDDEKDREIERLKDKNQDLQTINELLKRSLSELDKRKADFQTIGNEPTIFKDVAESKSELIKNQKNDDVKKGTG
ncbi:hypothetical protein [Flavobacterium sp. LC2016-23]|uniref:hypothetical protein n=1 Tax=Flavobacterium sp. LC2016-23 TaxID=2666330 RepID=UPI0018A1D08D|nr:hypothetical protein [Flavobacterium sp. LC2016-23]